MEKLMIKFNGNYVPRKLCAIARDGEIDDIDGCSDYCEDGCNGECSICAIQECFNKLAEYEDIGLTPEQLIEVDKLYAELCKELAEYKKLGTPEELKSIIKAAPEAGREGLNGKETP